MQTDVERMVLTALEVAQALRLCGPKSTPKEAEAAVGTVHRLVRDGKLRPLKPGKAHVFFRDEVARFMDAPPAGTPIQSIRQAPIELAAIEWRISENLWADLGRPEVTGY